MHGNTSQPQHITDKLVTRLHKKFQLKEEGKCKGIHIFPNIKKHILALRPRTKSPKGIVGSLKRNQILLKLCAAQYIKSVLWTQVVSVGGERWVLYILVFNKKCMFS